MDPKIVLVTGAGSGVGRSVALTFLKNGHSAVLAGRRQDRLDETVQLAGADGNRAKAVATDVGDPDAVDRLFAAAKERFGRLDVLFNNAGAGAPPVPIEELTWDQWKTVVDVNLHGVFLCTRAAVRMMKEQDPQGGRIINNGSIRLTFRDRTRRRIRPPSTPSLASPGRPRSTAGHSTFACGQIDIGNAATDMTAGMVKGVLQADGSTKVEPRFDVQHVADAVLYMANLPLDTTCSS